MTLGSATSRRSVNQKSRDSAEGSGLRTRDLSSVPQDSSRSRHSTASDEWPTGRLVGVLIGVDGYREADQLDRLVVASADARSIRRALAEAEPGTSWLRLVVTDPAEGTRPEHPSKQELVAVLTEAAREAGPADRVVVFFAGHGCLVNGRICLIPADGSPGLPESLLAIDELQAIFASSQSRHRLLLIDCCQINASGAPGEWAQSGPEERRSSVAQEGIPPASGPGQPSPGMRRRSAAPLDPACIEALCVGTNGWTVLTACSPNEHSWETPAREAEDDLAEDHGLFTHFLVRGLSGEADLDRDGLVSVAELVQYVSKAVTRRAREVEGHRQHPMVIWQGWGAMPVVRAVPLERRGPRRGTASAWARALLGAWPLYPIPRLGALRFGTAAFFGTLVATEVLLLDASTPGIPPWLLPSAIGLASAFVWLGIAALAAVAAPQRWHWGGYLGGAALAAWALALMALSSLLGVPAAGRLALGLRTDAVLLFGLMLVLALNPLHTILSLAALHRRGLDRPLKRSIETLDAHHADTRLTTPIPTVPVQPRFATLLFAVPASLFLLIYSLALVWADDLGTQPVHMLHLILIRNGIAILFLLWQTQAYAAAYTHIKNLVSRPV